MATSAPNHMRRLRRDEFDVGWICALYFERAASVATLDDMFGIDDYPKDDNVYTAGRIGNLNIVIASLPEGDYGIGSAAIVASRITSSFPSIEYKLLVGTGGGVPTEGQDIRLGDVVISRPMNGHGGVVNYDLHKIGPDGSIQPKGYTNSPPTLMLGYLSALRAAHDLDGNKLKAQLDFAFNKHEAMVKTYRRPACSTDQLGPHLDENGQADSLPWLHYGLIASGNKVINNAEKRDWWLKRIENMMCFEMEAGGLMNNFPCLVIRGISDYADGNKNDAWQHYAAIAAAAAYAREFLLSISYTSPISRGIENISVSPQALISESGLRGVTQHLRMREHDYWYFLTLKALDEYQRIYERIGAKREDPYVHKREVDKALSITQQQATDTITIWDRFHRCKIQNGRCTAAVARVPCNLALAYMYMVHIEVLQPELAASVDPLRMYESEDGCRRRVFSQGRLEILFAFSNMTPCVCTTPPCGRKWNFAAAEWGVWRGGPKQPLCALAAWSASSDAELRLADGPGAQLCAVIRKVWKGRRDPHTAA